MEIELEKKNECVKNTQDAFKEFFENKNYHITEDEQKNEALFRGHKVVLKQNASKEEYLMGANAGWSLTNSKDKSKHTIALSVSKNDNNEYISKYKLICDTNYTIKYPEFKSMQELLTHLFNDL